VRCATRADYKRAAARRGRVRHCGRIIPSDRRRIQLVAETGSLITEFIAEDALARRSVRGVQDDVGLIAALRSTALRRANSGRNREHYDGH